MENQIPPDLKRKLEEALKDIKPELQAYLKQEDTPPLNLPMSVPNSVRDFMVDGLTDAVLTVLVSYIRPIVRQWMESVVR
jgi:hypothetical protein